ncbi:hypothetical protein WJX72_001725 [[Myrmecia] bisecta]|uniref:Uncharacterized protein n=1 Tax=[Myrmecia] bisecta TaxID=41462 RepID=A0AAW1R5E8_9CHLO
MVKLKVQKKGAKGSAGKKGAKGSASGSKKRGAEEAFLKDDRDEFFLGSDAERDSGHESEEEAPETAEEKRLRLAKAYLQQLRDAEEEEFVGVGPAAESDEEEEGAEGGREARTHGAVSEHLRKQAMEAMGYLQRKIADKVVVPELRPVSKAGQASTSGRFMRCHRSSVTALALTADDATAFSVSKDGAIFQTDIETGTRTRFATGSHSMGKIEETGTTADWIKKAPKRLGGKSLLAAAVSDDGRYLAVGGGDRKVHVYDARTREYIQGFPGHKDIIAGLAFRDTSHELFSASFDRTVKIWSLDDKAYVDTLFGHQSEVLAVDLLRQERAVTSGHDHTCRVWKVPEESQLIYRAHGMAIDCCRYITGTEWLTGSSDGALAVWSQLKKKPVSVIRNAHHYPGPGEEGGALGAGSVGGDAAAWVGAVAVCKGSDFVASGAADGVVRLWAVREGRTGGARNLEALGGVPVRGFVNALQLARSGRFVLAGVGQEPRLGRWGRDPVARNGLMLHTLKVQD